MQRIAVFLALALVLGVNADLYMQGPRGSNNRLNEANAERNNGNRLFDSQNNNRGGYNVGDKSNSAATATAPSITTLYDETDTTTAYQYPMVYYEQSIMQIEWTLQHGCGGNTITDPTLQNCNLVLQYTCDRTDDNDAALNVALRDGTTTNTVTTAGTDNTNGYHENAQYYSECNTRSRNQGLFLADQNLNGNTAIYTRQNPTGTRQGLECAEERDYYPYWLPTPWVDIAYLTDRVDFCSKQATDPVGSKGYIADNSQNSSPKYKCYAATQTASTLNAKTRDTCAGFSGSWLSYTWGLPAPVCQQAQWSRSNHLGNSREGIQMMNFNWTLPSFTDLNKLSPTLYEGNQYAKCVLRMRYNISTDDYDMWNINATSNGATNSPVKDNGQVDVGASLQSLAMSINTDQFGRTFQDRSHTFYIKKRPSSGALATAKIINLNVRGKRGNIVQTYPANEYDFQPNRFHVTGGSDYIHLQWTGSNTHNNGGGGGDGQAGDDGEGTDGTDRHNFVQIKNLGENFPIPLDKFANNFFSAVNCFKLDGSTAINGGTSNADCAVWLATSGYFRSAATVTGATAGNDNLSVTLDNAPASLIGGVLLAPKSTGAGVYHFIGSRNNNFSNRSQKGTIIIDAPAATSA